jgi:hypothetical protein
LISLGGDMNVVRAGSGAKVPSFSIRLAHTRWHDQVSVN